MEENHSDEATMSGVNQLIAQYEIKQEPDIKEEPMGTSDLVELPALNGCGDEQPAATLDQWNGNDGIAVNPIDDIKIEVKEESGQKAGNVSKSKGQQKGAMDRRQGEHSPNPRANRSGNSTQKAKKPIKSNAQGKVLKQHRCDQCEYATKKKSHLERHLLIHTGEKPFPCSHCPKEFTEKRGLQNHMKMHVEEFLFGCAVCLKGFDKKNEKMKHEKECSIRRYECHLCKQSFGSNKVHLIRHIRVHSGIKPFECNECSKKFTTESNLKRHMELHSGPRSFYCSRCRKGFVQPNEMIAHEQKCSRRVYECYVCGKFIGLYKGNLDRHMRTLHTGDKPFRCLMCRSKFTRKENLTGHMNRIYNKSR